MASPFRVGFIGLNELSRKITKDTQEGLKKGLTRGALVLTGRIARTARVRTGRLRSSWTAAKPKISGTGFTLRATVGTDVKYARFVGQKGRDTGYRGAGEQHAKDSFEDARGEIERVVGREIEAEF